MTIRIVRLGSARTRDEGSRLGTVRRPPRGIPKSEFSSGNWYDVWYPVLAPSAELMKSAFAAKTDKQWAAFFRKFRSEMKYTVLPIHIGSLSLLFARGSFSTE